jgi:hypothetical protein
MNIFVKYNLHLLAEFKLRNNLLKNDMPTIKEALTVIKDCYKMDKDYIHPTTPNQFIGDTCWKREIVFDKGNKNALNHDFGCLYINENTREAIYVSRGSTIDQDWTKPDITIGMGRGADARIYDALENIKIAKALIEQKKPPLTLTLAGHSLGGYITQGISKATGLKGISINGPSDSKVETENVFRFDNNNDVVGGTGGSGINRLVVKTPQRDDLGGFDLIKNVGVWWEHFTKSLADNHQVVDIEKKAEELNLTETYYDKVTVKDSEEQKKFKEKVERIDNNSDTLNQISAKLNNEKISKEETPNKSLLDINNKIVFKKNEDGTENYGVSFEMTLDEVGKGLEGWVKNMTEFFSGKKEHTIINDKGEIVADLNNPDTPITKPEPTKPQEPFGPPAPEPTTPAEPAKPTEDPLQPILPEDPRQKHPDANSKNEDSKSEPISSEDLLQKQHNTNNDDDKIKEGVGKRE